MHHMVNLRDLLDKISLPIVVPESIVKMEQHIDTLIDGFIQELQMLRTKHHDYIRKYSEEKSSKHSLRRQLMRSEDLVRTELTGSNLNRMLRDIDSPSVDEDNPYSLPANEMEKRMIAARSDGVDLFSKIEQLWTPKPKSLNFRFSNTLKYQEYLITVSEDGLRAYPTTNTNFGVVLVEPALSMTNPSRVSFRINGLSRTYVGICYRQIVEKAKYRML